MFALDIANDQPDPNINQQGERPTPSPFVNRCIVCHTLVGIGKEFNVVWFIST